MGWIRSIFPTFYDALKMETFYDVGNTGVVEDTKKLYITMEPPKNFT